MTTALLSRHAEALDLFGGLVHAVRGPAWDAPTPCAEWSVRDLVGHLTGEQLWVPALVTQRRSPEEVGAEFDGDVLGDDPVGVWVKAAEAARAAFNQPGALEGTVALSYGSSPVADYCAEMTLDAVVHSWDLAKAIGSDDRLPAQLVEFALARVLPKADEFADGQYFGEPVEVPEDADDQTRLLAILGRRRDWTA
ncbi:TIGR03086 family metal-binding protein [Crossiella sp. NPDC003009]